MPTTTERDTRSNMWFELKAASPKEASNDRCGKNGGGWLRGIAGHSVLGGVLGLNAEGAGGRGEADDEAAFLAVYTEHQLVGTARSRGLKSQRPCPATKR